MVAKPDISIVVPVYNGSATLHELLERIYRVCTDLQINFEILLVDDGSKDQSWPIILELKKKYTDTLKGYRLAHNCGQQIATLCGLKYASGQWVITMDDDLQCRPEEIPNLLAAAKQLQADIIYGIYPTLRHGFLYNIGTRIFRMALRKVAPLYPNGSSFRLIHGDIVSAIPPAHGPQIFLDPMLGWLTSNIATVKVQHDKRPAGKSNYSFLKVINLAITTLIIHSTIPLRLMIWFGSISAIISFGLGIYFLIKKFTIGSEVGFSALIVTLTFASGIILLSLGILGEYIARIYTMGTGRPAFTIKTAA